MNEFEHMLLTTEFRQSETFGNIYGNILSESNPAFCSPLVDDIGDILNSILIRYDNLSSFQIEMLSKLFLEFNKIREEIDPNRLKPFEHYFNNDNELLLYRKSIKGLTNITINQEELIVFSYIPFDINEEKKFYFLSEESDFETLSYDFFM